MQYITVSSYSCLLQFWVSTSIMSIRWGRQVQNPAAETVRLIFYTPELCSTLNGFGNATSCFVNACRDSCNPCHWFLAYLNLMQSATLMVRPKSRWHWGHWGPIGTSGSHPRWSSGWHCGHRGPIRTSQSNPWGIGLDDLWRSLPIPDIPRFCEMLFSFDVVHKRAHTWTKDLA